LRVISGKYRGRKLVAPDGDGVRPTTDRVKEALFSSIHFVIPGAEVLDLFAGSGALGIEALSRGAKHCTFVESNAGHLEVLNKNSERIDSDFDIVYADYMNALKRLEGKQYDVVFLDPPYQSDFAKKAMTYLAENDMISDGGLIVLEASNQNIPTITEPYEIDKQKQYGKTSVLLIKKRM